MIGNIMSWEECKKKFIRKVEIDEQRIASIIKKAMQRLNRAKETKITEENVSFVVWEDDLVGDDPVITNPVNAVFSGGQAVSSWTAEWQDDALTDPEYYFIASLALNSTETITSTNQLIVFKGAVSSLCPDYALNGNK